MLYILKGIQASKKEINLKKKTKDILSIALKVLFSAGLLLFLFRQIDMEKTKEVLLSARLDFIVYAFLVYGIIFAVLLWRWWTLVRTLGLDVSLMTVARFHFLGLFFNPFLPTGIGGDVIKIIGLCAYTHEKPKVVGSVLLDRLVGFISMVVVATAAFILGYHLINEMSLIFSVIVLAVICAVLLSILFNEKIYTFCCRIFSFFPEIKAKLMEMHYDLALLKDRRDVIYLTVGYACLGQIIMALTYYLLARALHQDVSLLYFLIFSPLICVVTSLPSIGGLGVREVGTVFLFAKAGIATGLSVSISLMLYVFTVVVGLMGALFFLLTRSPTEDKVVHIKDGLKEELLD